MGCPTSLWSISSLLHLLGIANLFLKQAVTYQSNPLLLYQLRTFAWGFVDSMPCITITKSMGVKLNRSGRQGLKGNSLKFQRSINSRNWQCCTVACLHNCSVNLSYFKLNINKSNWKHFTLEPGNPLFEKTCMSDCICTWTSWK